MENANGMKAVIYCLMEQNVMITVSQMYRELCQTTDDQLFNKTFKFQQCNNVLHTLLPPLSTTSQHYILRRRTHTHCLPGHDSYLFDSIYNLNVVQRQLLIPAFITSFYYIFNLLLYIDGFICMAASGWNVTQTIIHCVSKNAPTLKRYCSKL